MEAYINTWGNIFRCCVNLSSTFEGAFWQLPHRLSPSFTVNQLICNTPPCLIFSFEAISHNLFTHSDWLGTDTLMSWHIQANMHPLFVSNTDVSKICCSYLFYHLSLRVLVPITQPGPSSVQSCPDMKYLEFSNLPPKRPICYTIMKNTVWVVISSDFWGNLWQHLLN